MVFRFGFDVHVQEAASQYFSTPYEKVQYQQQQGKGWGPRW